jgi:hypothetical protein
MSTLLAKFKQSPNEKKRYVSDFSLDLDTGETITTVTPTVFPPTGATTPALVCNGVAIAPAGTSFIYYVSGGQDGYTYEVQFLVATTLTKTLEGVVAYVIGVKV